MTDSPNNPASSGNHVASGVHEGDVLVGKYRIEKVLGAGGMGVVAMAHHLQLDERVAIKFLLPEALENRETVARFAREARAAVKIKSEHVARVVDVGELENGAPYMVMEYLEGSDLTDRVRARGPLPVAEATEFLLQACEAIAEAHSIGIIHRDLKPANLFIVRRRDGSESAKVLDFGISKTTGHAGAGPDMGMTSTKAVMGSPYYMSPEQLMSARNVDPGADIWSLGVVLFELLTGRLPFDAETFPQLCMVICNEPPAQIRALRADLPPALEAVIYRCMQKNREERYANVAELAADLAPFAPASAQRSVERISRMLGVTELPVSPGMAATAQAPAPVMADGTPLPGGQVPHPAAASSAMGGGTQATWGRSTNRTGSGAGVAVALGGVALLVAVAGLAVGGWWLLGRGEESAAAAQPTAAEEPEPAPPVAAAADVPMPDLVAAPSAEPSAEAAASPEVKPAPVVAPAPRPRPKPVAAPAPAPQPPPAPAPAPKPRKPPSDLYGDRK